MTCRTLGGSIGTVGAVVDVVVDLLELVELIGLVDFVLISIYMPGQGRVYRPEVVPHLVDLVNLVGIVDLVALAYSVGEAYDRDGGGVYAGMWVKLALSSSHFGTTIYGDVLRRRRLDWHSKKRPGRRHGRSCTSKTPRNRRCNM